MPRVRPCPVCRGKNYYQSGIFVCKNCRPELQALHDIKRNAAHAAKMAELIMASLRKKHPSPICQGKGGFYVNPIEMCSTCKGLGYKIPKDYQPEYERENLIEEEEY